MIKTALLLLCGISFVAACSDDRDGNPTILHPTAFALETPSYAGSSITLATASPLAFAWKQPDFGYPAKVNYQVQVSFTDKFTASVKEAEANGGTADYNELPTVYFGKSGEVNAKDFDQALQTLGKWEKDKVPATQKVYVRIKADYPNVATVYSNSVALNVVPYYIEQKVEPVEPDAQLFLTGSKYGWSSTWLQLHPVNGTVSKGDTDKPTFWILLYFDANEEVKFAPQEGWGNDFGYVNGFTEDHAAANLSSAGGNLKVGSAGWYLVVVENDGKKPKVSFEKPNVYLQGAVNGGNWDSKEENRFSVPTTADGEFVSPAFVADGDVRMCVKINGFDGWKSEFNVYDGKIVYRGNGKDQKRVKGFVGQRCHLNFTQGTGSFK